MPLARRSWDAVGVVPVASWRPGTVRYLDVYVARKVGVHKRDAARDTRSRFGTKMLERDTTDWRREWSGRRLPARLKGSGSRWMQVAPGGGRGLER